jgi:Spy/CpxP family protein refolding chaperone
MKKSLKMVAFGSVFVLGITAASTAGAQAPTTGVRDGASRREHIREHRAHIREKLHTLSPEQRAAWKAYQKAYQAERKALREQVKAGTLDKKTAAEQLKAWREANRPKHA